MGQAQINVRTRACSGTFIARTKQAALTHNVRGKELKQGCLISPVHYLYGEHHAEDTSGFYTSRGTTLMQPTQHNVLQMSLILQGKGAWQS